MSCHAAAEVRPEPPAKIPVVVIGVGNELYMDEGVGVVAARTLAQTDLPLDVTVVEGAVGGLNLLFEMERARRVILLDAVDMGEPPGTVRVFRPDQVRMAAAPLMASLHQVSLREVLELGALVGLTADIHVVAIQPERVAAGFELTTAVAAAIPTAIQSALALCQVACEPDPSPAGGI